MRNLFIVKDLGVLILDPTMVDAKVFLAHGDIQNSDQESE